MGFSENRRILDIDTVLITREELLTVCKEIDEDTPQAETDSFINSAHVYLYNVLDGWGIRAPLMKTIETYVAAHFAALSYPAIQRETVGPLSTSYVSKVELGLQNTRYGQMAITLDPTGRLKRLSDGDGLQDVKIRSIGSGILRK